MTNNNLENIWAALSVPTPRFGMNGRRAPGLSPSMAAYLGLDSAGRRHLLVLVPDGTDAIIQRDTKGLQVGTERFRIGDHPEALYIDLICLDSAQNSTFSAVVQDLLDSLRRTRSPRDAVVAALDRWRTFWRIRPLGLSREASLGLFGELWFLCRWLGPVRAATVAKWMATPMARHDFQWPTASVEVKTASSSAADGPVHHITGLDQLDDPERGKLHLFSLQVVDDALAQNTLPGLVEVLTEKLQGDADGLVLFNEKLATYGYDPAEANNHIRRLRIIGERLYHVGQGFPRITRNSFTPVLSNGIEGITYTLRVSACDPWLVAKVPTDPYMNELRAT